MNAYSRNRKRRSNRRKTSQQNICNSGFPTPNEIPTSCGYVKNANPTDIPSPSKKRKLSTQDVPGPSSYHTKNAQQMPNSTPMSEFYHSLLESSYEDDLNCMYKLHFILFT